MATVSMFSMLMLAFKLPNLPAFSFFHFLRTWKLKIGECGMFLIVVSILIKKKGANVGIKVQRHEEILIYGPKANHFYFFLFFLLDTFWSENYFSYLSKINIKYFIDFYSSTTCLVDIHFYQKHILTLLATFYNTASDALWAVSRVYVQFVEYNKPNFQKLPKQTIVFSVLQNPWQKVSWLHFEKWHQKCNWNID